MLKAVGETTFMCSTAENKLGRPERMNSYYTNGMYILMVSIPKTHEAHGHGLPKPVTQEQDSAASDLS